MTDTVANCSVGPTDRSARLGGVWLVGSTALLSGFAGLGYELVWTRLLAVTLGHELFAVLGVIFALFGGLALGSLLFGRAVARSAYPARWYAALEFAIGAWALILIPLLPRLGPWMADLVPIDALATRQWSVAFALPFVLLSPATIAMGGTLPALEAILARFVHKGAVAPAYAANTLGAVAGTLVTTFVLVPSIGLSATLVLCASVNVVCAALMIGTVPPLAIPCPEPRVPDRRSISGLAALFLTGLIGIGFEVVTIRVTSQILENTVFTFALLLVVYLLGTAAGAAMWTSLRDRVGFGGDRLTLAAAAAVLASALVLRLSPALLAVLRQIVSLTMIGRLTAELAISIAVFLPATVAMGALFAELAQDSRDRDGSLGPALAVNTFGAALGPIVFGPIAIPWIGPERALVAIALLYLAVHPRPYRLVIAAPLVALFAAAPSLLSMQFVRTTPGSDLIWHRDGVMASVSVIRDRAGDNHLQVNNQFRMGGTVSARSDHREAHIPLLLHPAPRRALFLGLGTGATLSAAGDHPGLRADGVELVPEVVDSFPLFAAAAPRLGHDDRLRIHVADARRFVRTATERYDVIVADLYHPSVDGSGALYALEHFEAIRSRLAAGGLFCQWLPLHQLDLATLRLIIRTFLAVFPDAKAYLAQFSVETPLIALVGGGPATYTAGWLDRRVDDPALRARLAKLDLKDDVALFGLYVADTADLRGLAGDGPLNSDDRPLAAYRAPRAAYVPPPGTPGERLTALLGGFHPAPANLLGERTSDAARRLADYWRARDRFLHVGARTLMSRRSENFVADVAPQLLDVLRLSADFDAAYFPLLAMAQQLSRTDAGAARRLLETLLQTTPARPEARRLLNRLPPA